MTRLAKMNDIGLKVVATLRDHCERIAIAGSVRRQVHYPHDVEIVCIPKKHAGRPTTQFCLAVQSLGKILKGKKRGIHNAKYLRLWVNEEHVDLFIVEPDVWGMQLLIRTGPADYSRHILAEFNKRGFHSENAVLSNASGKELCFGEEADIFEFLNFDYVHPTDRQ